ncbi:2-(1,2-epoxy-1,2-dihydrophenyl)acetyl-CoA isomerase [Nocardiopsis arvandica]|uniref:2-(1,2-epoxy-1,2-dihydrophenyl)acetyl-CoA isomerase n=1 Tax=Nocardiopsis sinuspersici TaxID=501010 RepID=A0A7Y9XGQ0_9ACTN|nr:enoyl-CoA hydratase-related protein [Nocardiopsis sinuspersici]NYH55509.1 2-(1,2-epoxy-1,2-dihydrophenyl)acetyl-CoA isomerase [Nocardiopsis sinuspersici]
MSEDTAADQRAPKAAEFSEADGLATVRLNTPGLTRRVKEELLDALRRAAESTTARAVLLLGSDKAFCVGQDLGEHARILEEEPQDALGTVREHYNRIVLALEDIQVPVVVGIGGACVGAGLGFALAGDVRVAARRAKFGTAFTGIGLASDSGLAYRLVTALGQARAMELMLLSTVFGAERALELGLVTEVVDDDAWAERARETALQLASGPTGAFVAAKREVRAAAQGGRELPELLEEEADLQNQLGQTADHVGAVRAFLNKEKPAFTGG